MQSSRNIITVLVLVDYYLPGYKGGGPIRTIANMVEQLGEEIDFRIVTRDRDLKSQEAYGDVLVDAWNSVDKAQVFYASPKNLSFRGLTRILRNTPHDILYLNSMFSPRLTGVPLLARRIGLYAKKPVILAPRGEFSEGAMSLKRAKKRGYISIVKMSGLYEGLDWQASSEQEAFDIRRMIGSIVRNIHIAPDLLPSRAILEARGGERGEDQHNGRFLRVVFLSRISPMKNLDFLLKILGRVNAPLQLSIYGPAEDPAYWSQCNRLMRDLPSRVEASYGGEVRPADVPMVFSDHDLFVFPTRGENFGHVIYESLAAGTPVVVSDKTPWSSDSGGVVEVLPLDQPDAWVKAIERWAEMTDADRAVQRERATRYARDYVENSEALELNRRMFHEIIKNSDAPKR